MMISHPDEIRTTEIALGRQTHTDSHGRKKAQSSKLEG